MVPEPGDRAGTSSAVAAPGDVVDFLREHPPFDALEVADLERVAAAGSPSELARAAEGLRPSVIALHDARVAASSIATIYSVLLDALTRRLIELALARAGESAAEFSWLALGSQARRDATAGSDADSAMVWFGEVGDEVIRPYLHSLATDVVAGLGVCGIRADGHGVTASEEPLVRSIASWQRVARSWIEHPSREQALILVSVFVDSRPVWGVHSGSPLSDTFRSARARPELLHLLARFALTNRPPTGFLHGLVVQHSGEHRGRLDLKRGGLLPIVDLARWAGMAAGVTSASTAERLRAAADAGTLPAAEVHTLEDAFELFTELRMAHQVEQLRAGLEPDDHLNPIDLSGLARSNLKEAFRAVASVQRHLTTELNLGAR